MFNEQQIRELSAPLDTRAIKAKPGSPNAEYVEGWRIAETASKIFGFGNWDRELLRLELVDCTERGEGSGKYDITYLATMRVSVRAVQDAGLKSCHTGTGVGTAKNQTLAEGHETAAKSAETDAMKRALAFGFGNQFGLACYAGESRQIDVREMLNVKAELEAKTSTLLGTPKDSTELLEMIESLKNGMVNSNLPDDQIPERQLLTPSQQQKAQRIMEQRVHPPTSHK
ncbi:hypothetical protein CMI37_31185 [Candidatus Pacearchaeota archaeon]|nr:hypothetical protein [Candidatus Pacearchaeota archaeon]|tara:strand:+ start:865 stop:1548 length:684 start_codon:yes stop_codon:yes gene_type:complete